MPQAIDQFEQTVRDSSLENVHPVLADIKAIDSTVPLGRCDLVTCNPPYKAAGAGIISDTDAEKAARHETMCTIDDICAASARLLRYGGRLCLCNRPERLADMICAMRAADIEPKRLRFVAKNGRTPPWLVLLEGRRGGKPSMNGESTLYMTSDGISPELRMIYGQS